MSHEIIYIDHKLHGRRSKDSPWEIVVLCTICKHQYVFPGIWYSFCEQCQDNMKKGVSNA